MGNLKQEQVIIEQPIIINDNPGYFEWFAFVGVPIIVVVLGYYLQKRLRKKD